jgi:hypothetical protein
MADDNQQQPLGPVARSVIDVYLRMSTMDPRFGHEAIAALGAAVQLLENRLAALELNAELRAALDTDNNR